MKNNDPLDNNVDESKEFIPSYIIPTVIIYNELAKYRKNRLFGKFYNIGVVIGYNS